MPLINEAVKREKESQELEKELKERTKNLKILFALIRSPKMCNLFYKEERRRWEK